MGETNEVVAGQAQAAASVVRGITRTDLLEAEAVLGSRCATCDGYMCMDCAESAPHAKCTRVCPECLVDAVDWDEELEMNSILTELAGLDALDRAIAELAADEDGESGRRSA